MRSAVAFALIAAGWGCGRDIRLAGGNDDEADAATEIDAAVGIVSGSYRMTHGSSIGVTCGGDMQGMEASFDLTEPEDAGLVEGAVALETTTVGAVVSGPSIEGSFSAESLELTRDLIPEQPPNTIFAVIGFERPGPEGTTARIGVLGLNEEGASDVFIDGQTTVVFSLDDPPDSLDHNCAVTFSAAFVAP